MLLTYIYALLAFILTWIACSNVDLSVYSFQ